MALRFERTPSSARSNQWPDWFPPSLRSNDGGPSRLFTATSMSPSLSKSANAAPRLDHDFIFKEDRISSNFPLPEFRNHWHGSRKLWPILYWSTWGKT